jgi:subtilisin family serine protease
VIFAAGNDDRELQRDEMEAMPEVLCVSAADSYGRPTNYTNYGDSVAVAAPSATVSIAPENGITETFGGTSAAAPVASGLSGWVLSVAPELSATELKTLLMETAEQSPLIVPDENGHDPYYGYGIISAVAVKDALTVEDTGGKEEPKACGCSTSSGLEWLSVFLWPLQRRRSSAPCRSLQKAQ